MRTFEWLARLTQILFFVIFADVQIFLQMCDSQENIYIRFFLNVHFKPREKYCDSQRNFDTLKILSSETL